MGLKFARGANDVLYTLQRHYEVNPRLSMAMKSTRFDGTSYLLIPTLDDTPAVTYEVWLKLEAYGSNDVGIITKNYGDTAPYHIRNLVIKATGELEFYGYNSGFWAITSSQKIPLNEWTHVAVTADTAATLFINGVPVKTQGIGYGIGGGQYSDKHVVIGGHTQRYQAASGSLRGRLYDARIWNVRRTESKVWEFYNRRVLTGDAPDKSPVVRYLLDQDGTPVNQGQATVTVTPVLTSLVDDAPLIFD